MNHKKRVLQTVPTHCTPEQLVELHKAGKVIDSQYVLVEQYGRQFLSRIRIVQQKESRR